MHSFQEIIKNQEKFKEEILSYLLKELSNAKKELRGIKSENEFILIEKQKLIERFKKSKPDSYLKKLFFIHSKRNKFFYVWWDKENKEGKILKYEKKQRRKSSLSN